MAAPKSDNDTRHPGTAPGAQVRDTGPESRYGSPPASVEDPLVRADSPRAMIEEVVKREVAAALGRQADLEADAQKQAAESRRRAEERRQAEQREHERRLESLVEYEALADGWVPMPDPRQGGRLVHKGERFLFGGIPSPRWMKALTPEGQKRIDARAEQQAELRRLKAEDQVALTALQKATRSIERASLRQ